MKKLLIAAFLLAHIALAGQVLEMESPAPLAAARVVETEGQMVNGMMPALMVVLEVTDAKLVDKVWKDFMKDYGGKTKRAKGGKENLTSAEIVGINGVNPIDIYSRSDPGMDGYVEHIVWFDLGGEYLSSNRKAQYAEAEKMLLKFAHTCKVEHTRSELAEANKKLKSLESDMDKLARQNTGYHKDIADAEKRIEQAKENILKNEEQQSDTTKKIEIQKELVDEINRRLKEIRGN